jgi:hypothetical protein
LADERPRKVMDPWTRANTQRSQLARETRIMMMSYPTASKYRDVIRNDLKLALLVICGANKTEHDTLG